MVVLLAEDNEDDAGLFERMVEWSFPSHRVRVVPDGEEAIRYLSGEPPYSDRRVHPMPDIVFLDVLLPGRSGLAVLEWIRADPKLNGLPVIMLTGLESQEVLRQAYGHHANSVLHKSPILTLPNVSRDVFGFWLQHSAIFPRHNPGP